MPPLTPGGCALRAQREAQERKGREGWAFRVSLGLALASPARVPARYASPWVQRGPAGFCGGADLEEWGGGDKPSANTVLAWVTRSPVPSQEVSSLASISTSIGHIWAPGCRIEVLEGAGPEAWTREPGRASTLALPVWPGALSFEVSRTSISSSPRWDPCPPTS